MLIDAGDLGFSFQAGQIGHRGGMSPAACHCCDVSSKICCPGTNPLMIWARHSLHALDNIVSTVHPRLSGHVGQPFSKILTG